MSLWLAPPFTRSSKSVDCGRGYKCPSNMISKTLITEFIDAVREEYGRELSQVPNLL